MYLNQKHLEHLVLKHVSKSETSRTSNIYILDNINISKNRHYNQLVFPDRIPIRIVEISYNFDNPDRDISIHFLYLYKNYMIRSIFICFLSKINKQLRVINCT